MIQAFRVLPQSLQVNAGLVTQLVAHQLPIRYFLINYSLIIPSLDVIHKWEVSTVRLLETLFETVFEPPSLISFGETTGHN